MGSVLYTKDVDGLFFPKLEDIAADLGATALDMISVMYSESGCKADAWNDNPKDLPPEQRWNASGLIQFMPPTLKLLGWTRGHAAFRTLNATQQLDYVHAYYMPYRGQLRSVGALYTATFLPALVARSGDRDFVLTARNGPLGWAFAPNASFDANHDFAITVGELEDAVRRNCRGPRWAELLARIDVDGVVADPIPIGIDLGTIVGLQRGLTQVGFSPGACDGIPGPKTAAAIVAFQRANGLTADGIFGPATRAALDVALNAPAPPSAA